MHPAVKRWLLRGAFAYILCVLLITLFQREFIYYPWYGPTNPEEAGLVGYSAAHFTATDGQAIPYWHHESSAANAPIMLYFHGNGGGLHMFTGPLAWFAEHGYHVAAMEYRGYPGAPGKPNQTDITADAAQFIAHMKQQMPHNPMWLWGYSLGSGIAVQAAAQSSASIDKLILEAPFTSVANRAGEMMPWMPAKHLIWDRYDSIGTIGALTMPITILHGSEDPLIPIAHGKALFEAANHPKNFIEIDGADHWNLLQKGAYHQVPAAVQNP